MRLKTLKTEAELFNAIAATLPNGRALAELITKDGKIKAVRIGTAHITYENYSLSVEYEINEEQVSRYRVVATIQGMPPQISYFEDYSEMSEKSMSYGTGVNVDTNNGKQIEVLIDNSGTVISEVNPEDAFKGVNNIDNIYEDVPF